MVHSGALGQVQVIKLGVWNVPAGHQLVAEWWQISNLTELVQ